MRALIAFFLCPITVSAQPLTPELLTVLQPAQNEVSGLLRNGTDLWTNLDSFNPNKLFRIDVPTGQVLQELLLTNASNVDWEAITTDGTWVYVGDIGNNAGSRSDLCIYRFPLLELTATATSVFVDTIRFSYADQTDFTPAIDNTNWDAEAIIALDDSLFIFTKNWLDERTHVYALPTQPGTHVAQRRNEYDVQGLVTDATRDTLTGDVILLGHTEQGTIPFVWTLRNFVGHDMFSGMNTRHPLTIAPMQAEAVAISSSYTVTVGNEWLPEQLPALWELQLPVGVEDFGERGSMRVYPVPTNGCLHIVGSDAQATVRVLDRSGTMVLTTPVTDGTVELKDLPTGCYVMEVVGTLHIRRVPIIVAQ
jgi:hypothetical protein